MAQRRRVPSRQEPTRREPPSRLRKKPRVSPARRAWKIFYRILVALSAVIVVLFCAYRLAAKKPEQAQEPEPPAQENPSGSLSPVQSADPGRQRREGTYKIGRASCRERV